MKAIQLEEWGRKHWLVEMPGPCLGGGRNVARREGQNGEALIFDSKDLAEEWITATPEWYRRTPTYVTPGTVQEVPAGGASWDGLNVKELSAVIAVSDDVEKLQAVVDNDPRSTAAKAAQKRLDELEGSE